MTKLYLNLEAIFSSIESDLQIINHISNYSYFIEEIDKEPIKDNFWKYFLIAKELYLNNLILYDYITKLSDNTLKQLENILDDMKDYEMKD